MDINVDTLYLNYTKRIIIYAVFFYKRKIASSDEYCNLVSQFIKSRVPFKSNVEVFIREQTKLTPKIRLSEIIDDINITHDLVYIKLDTHKIKGFEYIIDLKREEDYMTYIKN